MTRDRKRPDGSTKMTLSLHGQSGAPGTVHSLNTRGGSERPSWRGEGEKRKQEEKWAGSSFSFRDKVFLGPLGVFG